VTSWTSRTGSWDKGYRKYTPPVTYFLQLGPTSYCSPPSNTAIILWIHEGIKLLIRSEPSGSSQFPKLISWQPTPDLPMGDSSFSNHTTY
jgi:hypothetical protein